MSVIIRLQNLPWSANALDIRQFFQGLSIPEGGVHIVGGEQGDAFIAFSTDEDARQAMMHTGGKLKETQVSLLLSSRTEMQKVIDTARQKVLAMQATPSFPLPSTPQVPNLAPQVPTIPQITPHIPSIPQSLQASLGNILPSNLAQNPLSNLPLAAQMVAAQRMLPMMGLNLAQLNPQQQMNSLQQHHPQQMNSQQQQHLPQQINNQQQHHPQQMTNNQQNPMMHHQQQMHHLQQQQQQNHNQQQQMHHQQQMQQNHHQQQQMQMQQQRQQQQQNNNNNNMRGGDGGVGGGIGDRRGREERPDRTERRRSRSKERRSRDRPERRGSDAGTRGGRRRKSRSKSRDRDRNRRRDRSRSRERSKEKNRDRDRRRDDRSKGKSDKKEENSNGKAVSPSPSNSSQPSQILGPPMPWASPSNLQGAASGATNPTGLAANRFPPFQPPPSGGDNASIWGGQQAFNPQQQNKSQQSPQQNFQSHNNGPPGRIQRPLETCVELCNLPSSVGYRDIREFFHDQHVLNIKLLCDMEGAKVGTGYIKFGSIESKVQALNLNGRELRGGKRIEIKDCTEVDYDRAFDSYQPNLEQAVVSVSNIPPNANEMDVKRVFHGARIHNVVLMHPGENSSVPDAFVHFSMLSERNRAVAASGKVKIDGQEIFCRESTFDEIFRAQKAVLKGKGARVEEKRMLPKIPETIQGPVVSECILLQGLPSTVTNRQILDFFSDVGLIPLHIHIMQDSGGVPVGDVFCEFKNPIEGARALAKNKTMLGSTEVVAKAVTRQDMETALGMPKKQSPGGMMLRGGQDQMRHMRPPPHFMGGRPPFDPRFAMRGPFPRGPPPPHMMGMRPRPPFPGPGGMNGNNISNPSGEPSVDNFGKPGCVIEVTNVPFQADVDEILSFFTDFELTRQNVIRRYNDMGKPTGDVRVAFNNPADAQRAIAIKYKKIRDRPIFLNLLS